ncbi:MAG: glycosyltransferase [Rhodospirillum sp.]|nr:glycosyltransferase [Rhodospirillum sp.]MCF8488085.1 glycosyltransferase [Rhodospirillum sp.]MCF8499881.1 glycosyltransferase [Rhodospirillum sp.]
MRVQVSSDDKIDIAVLSTATLPWRTGPAYLSLWHACGLAERGHRVVLGIPWISPSGQKHIFGSIRFPDRPAHRAWLREEAARLGCPPLPPVRYYPGYYAALARSIVPLTDVFSLATDARAILMAEPEHLCWFPFVRSRRRVPARRIIGIVMTNYLDYLERNGAILGKHFVLGLNKQRLRTRVDELIPLSPAVTLDDLDRPIRKARVTGVLPPYFDVPPPPPETGGAYFLARMVWEKGFADLIEVSRRMALPVTVHGDGPDRAAIEAEARAKEAPLTFTGLAPSPWQLLPNHRVMINPSTSEVLCTATADAMVAGRHVVLPRVPCNAPFLDYPNVHGYAPGNLTEAEAAIRTAMATEPVTPIAARRDYDWRTACETLETILLGEGT